MVVVFFSKKSCFFNVMDFCYYCVRFCVFVFYFAFDLCCSFVLFLLIFVGLIPVCFCVFPSVLFSSCVEVCLFMCCACSLQCCVVACLIMCLLLLCLWWWWWWCFCLVACDMLMLFASCIFCMLLFYSVFLVLLVGSVLVSFFGLISVCFCVCSFVGVSLIC